MKAGRELDVKIGDEFFDMEFWYGDPTGFGIEENIDYWIVGSENSYGELGKRCPFFTTQIADAWLVVERFVKDGYLVTLEGDSEDWRVYVIVGGTYEGEVVPVDGTMQIADTAPLAICLAALEAIA